MTDTNTAAAPAADSNATKAPKPKTTFENMSARKTFADSASMLAYLAACGEKFTDFNSEDQTIIIPFVTEDGEIDSDKFDAPGYESMVATLKERGATSLKAIVVTPIPTLDLLLESDDGRQFVQEIVRKELNHRAVRQLRVAENPATVADQIPYSVESFTSSSRGDAGIVEAYNELYKHVNDTLSKASPAWKRRKLTKSELRAALESKAFALDSYPELEEAGANGSLFVMALKLGAMTAEKKGLDPTIFNRWLESRDAAAYEATAEEDEALDFDSLAEAMLAEPKAADSDTEASKEEEAAPTA
jgi:hypothetical protein